MGTRDPMTLIVGIGLIVIGALLVLGRFSLGIFLDVAGIFLLILGILILIRVLPGGTPIGVAALVLGIILMANVVAFPKDLRDDIARVMDVVNLVVGIVCIIFGILKLK